MNFFKSFHLFIQKSLRVFLVLAFFGLTNTTYSQTNWIGVSNSSWTNPANWTAGVPDANDLVNITSSSNQPIISSGTSAVVRAITFQGTGITLTVNSGASLEVKGIGAFIGINMATDNSLINNGTISIGTGGVVPNGFIVSTLTNGVSGIINIDNSNTYITVRNILHNYGTINLGLNSSISRPIGISIGSAEMYNYSGAKIFIDKISTTVISLSTFSQFSNSGDITFGETVTPAAFIGSTTKNFYNNTGGTIFGTGPIANYITHAGGKYSPGYSPGIITFSGGQNFSNSVFDMEIDGTAGAGVAGGHDQIMFSSPVNLGGAQLNLIFGYEAAVNDQFTIATGNFTGNFGAPNINNVGMGNVSNVSLSYVSNSTVRVTVTNLISLPVELLDFTASENKGKILLEWHTASENNNEGFEIERSEDGRTWKQIGFREGRGHSSSLTSYHFLDENPFEGQNYYRLKQMDFDGEFEYSKIIHASLGVQNDEFLLFPNPARDKVSFLYHSKVEGQVLFKIFNIYGEVVKEFTWWHFDDASQMELDLKSLTKGIYLVQISNGTKHNQQMLQIN